MLSAGNVVRAAGYALNTLKGSWSYKINRMDTASEVISRLKFIGKLKKGEKINTRHMYVQQAGYTTSFSRTFLYQDNRGNALDLIQDTISRAFELLITYQRSEKDCDKTMYKHLVKDLSAAIVGLVNLKFTYLEDTKFCCDMDTILEGINARLSTFIEES
jgi:hypothetical protein